VVLKEVAAGGGSAAGPAGVGGPSRRRVADAEVRWSTVWADRRLGPLAVLAGAGVVLGLVTGDPTYAAAGGPAALMLALAGRHGRAPGIAVEVVEPPDRLLEGDRWDLELRLRWTGHALVDVVHLGAGGHVADVDAEGGPAVRSFGTGGSPVPAAAGGRRAVRVAGEGGAVVRLPLHAVRWGRHGLGSVRLRARRPGGLLVHDLEVALPGVVRVLPAAARLDALLAPTEPRTASGAHATRRRGLGTDVADLRPYAPGDRLRDVSWAASARSDEPWVVVRHPERAGSVVLVLDGFTEVGVPAGALDRAARVAWSIARHHLAAGDRVGLVAAGPVPRWMPPAAGRRARWLVLDALLRADPAALARRRSRPGGVADDAVPADAVVVGISALQSDAFVAALAHHRRQGRRTVAVEVGLDDLLPPAADVVERTARRLWALEVEDRRARLEAVGVGVVPAGDHPAGAIRALARRAVPA